MTPAEAVTERRFELPSLYIDEMLGKSPNQVGKAIDYLTRRRDLGTPEEQALRQAKLAALKKRLQGFARLAAKSPKETRESIRSRERRIKSLAGEPEKNRGEINRMETELKFLKERLGELKRLKKKSPGEIGVSIASRKKALERIDREKDPVAYAATEAELEVLRERRWEIKREEPGGWILPDREELEGLTPWLRKAIEFMSRRHRITSDWLEKQLGLLNDAVAEGKITEEEAEPFMRRIGWKFEKSERAEARQVREKEKKRRAKEAITAERIDPQWVRQNLSKREAREILMRIFLEDHRALFMGRKREERLVLDHPIEIGGEVYRTKEAVVDACRLVLEGEEDFLIDVRVWERLSQLQYTVHESIKTAISGRELETMVKGLEDLCPTEREWSEMVAYFMEWEGDRGDENWQEHFAVYADPEFIIDDFKRRKRESMSDFGKRREGAWKDYLDSLEKRGIEIKEEALEEVRALVFSQRLEDRAKLKAIEMMREISAIPLRVGKKNRMGVELPDAYPTGGLSREVIKRQIEGVELPKDRRSYTHVLNRVRRVVGFMDAVTTSLVLNEDYKEWLYHTVRYAVQSRILAMTVNGVSIYGSSDPERFGRLERPSDIEDLAPERGNNLTLADLMLISGIAIGPEKPARTGDFLAHLEPRDVYSERNLRKRGIPLTVIPRLSWIPGRTELTNLFAGKVSLEKYVLVYGIEAPGRGDEGVARLNLYHARQGYCAWAYQKIFEAFGVPDISWRSISQMTRYPKTDEYARIYLGYLNQREKGRTLVEAADGTELELCDRELITALFRVPLEFEKMEIPYTDERGRRQIAIIDEAKLVRKLVGFMAQGIEWKWTTESILEALGDKLTLEEREYFKYDDVEHPSRMRDKIGGLFTHLLSQNELFDVIYALGTERKTGLAHLYIKEVLPDGRESIREAVVDPARIKRETEFNRKLRAVLAKIGWDRAVRLAREYGEVNALGDLRSLAERVGVNNVLALAELIDKGKEITLDDPIYKKLVLPRELLASLQEKGKIAAEAKKKSAKGERLDDREKELLDFDLGEALQGYGKLRPDEFSRLRFALRDKNLRKMLLGKPRAEITKDHPLLEGLSDEEKELLRHKMQSFAVRRAILEGGEIGEELGLAEEEQLYRHKRIKKKDRVLTIEREAMIDEAELMSRWRENRLQGREETAGFNEEQKDYFYLNKTQVRWQAIDDLEKTTGRQFLNELLIIMEKRGRGEELTPEEEAIWLKGRSLIGDETRIREKWKRVHTGEEDYYYVVGKGRFNDTQLIVERHLRELLSFGNWGVMRRTYDLDYPWLDLQQRHFLSKVYDWAILNKIGFFGKRDERGRMRYPLQESAEKAAVEPEARLRGGTILGMIFSPLIIRLFGRRNPNMPIEIARMVLEEKKKMYFRYGLRLEREGVLEPTPVIPDWKKLNRWRNGEVIGDPAMGWEVGDRSYSHAWIKHRRWDWPDTLAPHNVVMQIIYHRILTSPRFIHARGEKLERIDIMRLVPTIWDLFKTPRMDPRWFLGGVHIRIPLVDWHFDGLGSVLKKREEGYYYTLEKMGVLSSRMAAFMRRAEGAWRVKPEDYRSWMARFGIEDTKTGEVGGEEVVSAIMGGTIAQLPGLDVILGKLPLTRVPRMLFETAPVGFAAGVAYGLAKFLLTAYGTASMMAPPIFFGVLAGAVFGLFTWWRQTTTVESLTYRGILYDCIIPPDEMAKSTVESIRKRLGGLLPRPG